MSTKLDIGSIWKNIRELDLGPIREEAEADRDATIKTAEARQEGEKAKYGAETEIALSERDFKTKKAPDLKLFLSSRELSSVDGTNATSRAVLIAKLSSVRGAQRYAIPSGVDLDEHSTLLLHCEKYEKLWGGAKIR